MCFSKKGYFSNKALFYSLDLLYEHQSNISFNLKKTYIVVDFDKTLIIKDALLKLIFICFLSNGLKYSFLVLSELFKTLGQIDKLDDLKIWFKYAFSVGIVKIYDGLVLKKLVKKIFYKYKRDNLLKRLKKLNNLGINILVATNNYEYFLKDLIDELNFELVANKFFNVNDYKKLNKNKITRIKEYLANDKEILASVSDNIIDKKMLELVSDKIYKDYKLNLFFSIKT
ncbi:haloacid dehalogenase-like hydrolase [Prochlorococcus sp. AH-736-A21]|nr:haloacid dehalogenase-like hydrolase [Prochlorococcus sp. AH-736-A21]